MKTELVKRVERMESRIVLGIGAAAIFTTYVFPGHIDRPVKGWSFGDWNNRVQVLRRDGESDADLRKRAAVLFRELLPGRVPDLTSIK
jgi:hypothetical protein